MCTCVCVCAQSLLRRHVFCGGRRKSSSTFTWTSLWFNNKKGKCIWKRPRDSHYIRHSIIQTAISIGGIVNKPKQELISFITFPSYGAVLAYLESSTVQPRHNSYFSFRNYILLHIFDKMLSFLREKKNTHAHTKNVYFYLITLHEFTDNKNIVHKSKWQWWWHNCETILNGVKYFCKIFLRIIQCHTNSAYLNFLFDKKKIAMYERFDTSVYK